MLTVKKLRRKPKHYNFTGLTLSSSTNCSRPEPLYEQAEQERLETPTVCVPEEPDATSI
jgi:hypothetical protein